MVWAKVVFLLVAIQAISPLFPPRAVRGDILSPFLSPIFNGICDAVECGKGRCQVSLNHTFGFVCQCNPGWSQFLMEDHFHFLPCIIPNCSINYSCSNLSLAPAPSPLPSPPTNLSLFDPCTWAFCGGGKCLEISTYEHRCECKEGFSNLFNVTTYPCYRDCSLGADCATLGINISNSTTASPPNLPDNGSSSSGDPSAPQNLLWLFISMISLAMVRATLIEYRMHH